MRDLFTNRSSEKDFVRSGLSEYVEDGMDIFIATAFFTEIDVINSFIEKGCNIRIVVRLGYPTSPNALKKLLTADGVDARFYTSHSFHPKLYIFGDKRAMVGSANLTGRAINSNQEVVVGLQSDDVRFEALTTLFSAYWDEAEVLTLESIDKYRAIFDKYRHASELIEKLDGNVKEVFGELNFSNIDRGKRARSKKSIFYDSYSKSYQDSVSAFEKVQKIYLERERRVNETAIPVRLEIDSFISFVRDRHAGGEAWAETPVGWDDERQSALRALIDEWLSTEWDYFDETIVSVNYPLIQRVFGSEEAIDRSTEDEIVDALCVLHSFHDRLRFFKGGLGTLRSKFLETNRIEDVRRSIKHLLYGQGDPVRRMSDCCFSDEYKLSQFGQANVQELIGWMSKESLPVINGRTTKVLRYLGFDVKQIQEYGI